MPTNEMRDSSYGGLILDGVTGSGKSTILTILPDLLHTDPIWECGRIFAEEETWEPFGKHAYTDPKSTDESKMLILAGIAAQAEQVRATSPAPHFIFERSHLSLYADLPQWHLFEAFNERLARLDTLVVLLDISDDVFEERSIDRKDRPGNKERLAERFGGDDKIVKNLRSIQNRRKEALAFSKLPHYIVDTSNGKWIDYAIQIKALLINR